MAARADLQRSLSPRKTISTSAIRDETSGRGGSQSAVSKTSQYGKTPHNSPNESRPKTRKRPHSPTTNVAHNSTKTARGFKDGQFNENTTTGDGTLRDQKRSRSGQWKPKVNKVPDKVDEPWDLQDKSGRESPSPSNNRGSSNAGRPSKFLEGSMHDRTSNKPPSVYIKNEQLMDQYLAGVGSERPNYSTHLPNHLISHHIAGTDDAKPSGIFRFGKAVASVFNPLNLWQGFGAKRRDIQEQDEHPDSAILKERQLRAEKAYLELKQSGFKGTNKLPHVRHSAEVLVPAIQVEHDSKVYSAVPHRDSGIDVGSYRSSAERNEDGRKESADDYLLPPPSIAGFGRSASPSSVLSYGKRSSLHLRTPSLQSLKKAGSYFHLPSTKRPEESVTLGMAMDRNKSMQDITHEQAVRKQPSRKDLEKQQKLGKKVSDLEAKLGAARRDLELARGDEPTSRQLPHARKTVVPGLLPSLPSERILNRRTRGRGSSNQEHTGGQKEAPNTLTVVPTASTDQTPSSVPQPKVNLGEHKATFAARAGAKVEQNKKPVPKKPAEKKRKVSGGNDKDTKYKPDTEDDDDAEWKAATTTPGRKSARPRKSQKIESIEQSLPLEVPPAKETKQPTETEHSIAVQPATQPVLAKFEPEAIDQSKFLRMRSKTEQDKPFGQIAEDIVNLRREYPSVTDGEIVQYIASLLHADKPEEKEEPQTFKANAPLEPLIEEKENTGMTDRKIEQQEHVATRRLRRTYSEKTLTQHTSVAHPNQPPPAFLGRPRSASPVKIDVKKSPRLFSPPPSMDYSKPAANLSRVSVVEKAITASPGKDGSIPPMPDIPKAFESDVKPVRRDGDVESQGNVKKVEKEEYEWPEDVF